MATTDKRDEILQRHTPTVMVPRYGRLDLMETNGHRFLVAEDGIWLDVRRPWLRARHRLGDIDMPLPYGLASEFTWHEFTADDLARIRTLFRYDAEAAMPNECAAWGVWSVRSRRLEYRLLKADEASPGSVTFQRPQLEEHEHLAVDLHSHGALPAGFSSTDDEDDAGEVKYSTVYGGIGSDPHWATRLCLLGLFLDVGL